MWGGVGGGGRRGRGKGSISCGKKVFRYVQKIPCDECLLRLLEQDLHHAQTWARILISTKSK